MCADGEAQAPVQLVWMFADSPPASHEYSARESLWGKHQVDLIPRFPCAGCNGAGLSPLTSAE